MPRRLTEISWRLVGSFVALFLLPPALEHSSAVAAELPAQANVPVELSFTAAEETADPFHDVVLDAIFTQPDGTQRQVPGFWAGGRTWKVRYASGQEGRHTWKCVSNRTADAGLHQASGTVQVGPYTGTNPLFRHGPIRVAADQRHFEHADGTPFFWLGDTWWMGLSQRLHWPDDFQRLTADRVAKGFNVVQIVAGLYPDMAPFDPRGANEAGFPWEPEYARIRPAYFDKADERLRHLVDQGITPCIVGAWGYFLPWMQVDKASAHWRYLIARYGAWPVVWCAAGEANLPYYLTKGFPYDDRSQVHGWTEVLRSIRASDPWRRPLTIHPTAIQFYTARHATDDVSLLDFDMLQTPHGQREAVPIAVQAVRESYQALPRMPVINGEASYEKLADQLPTEWTRAMFWLCLTGGAAGHTYGANGIWQVNRRGDPHGNSPHGGNYGLISWDDAMNLPGSSQMALGKRFFESLPWTQLAPRLDTARWSAASGAEALGDWIWFPEGEPCRDAPVAARFFRRTFDLPDGAQVSKAVLHITADDRFTVWLNGAQVGSAADWQHPAQFDVAKLLRAGQTNVLAVRAENAPAPVKENPAGLAAALQIEIGPGQSLRVASGSGWRVNQTETPDWQGVQFDDTAWPLATVTAKWGDAPWGQPAVGAAPVCAPQVCAVPDAQPGASPEVTAVASRDKLRVIYLLEPVGVIVEQLMPGANYRLKKFDPVTGEYSSAELTTADPAGQLTVSPPAHGHDWVLLIERP